MFAIGIVVLAASSGWVPVKANGFTFEMPAAPVLTTEPITWPTTGQMTVTRWTSDLKTGDKQFDLFSCYQSIVETPRLLEVMHGEYCKLPAPIEVKYDRVDAATKERECLWLGAGPDGKRRTLVKIVTVGDTVCVLSSSARADGSPNEPSAGMRRFVDSLRRTGKQTVLAANTPWVTIPCPGCTFLLPKAATPEKRVDGKMRSTRWKHVAGQETYDAGCTDDPKLTAKAMLDLAISTGAKNATRHDLPGGAYELAAPGMLTRIYPQPKSNRVCMLNAYSQSPDALSTDARRFVESFAWTK